MTRLLWSFLIVLMGVVSTATGAQAQTPTQVLQTSGATGSPASPFFFVALGDLPYGPAMLSHPPYERLIAQINRLDPVFSVHIGDFKSGSSICSDEAFVEQLGFFNRFERPLVYTPGDNEWTDCHRALAGRFDPRERLHRLRQLFFTEPRSLGRRRMELERQSEVDPKFEIYVENARFTVHGIQFLTVHIVGSNNGLDPKEPAAVEEFKSRELAVVSWLEQGFAKAVREQAPAIVVMFHADVFDEKGSRAAFAENSGFARVIGRTLLPLAKEFDRPVLVIHGDSHQFRVDNPFRDSLGQAIANLTRLEVFGATDTRAVKVTVDLGSPSVFGFSVVDGS